MLSARRIHRTAGVTGGVLYGLVIVLASLVIGYGWLYALRGMGLFRVGPRIGDALPLLQLAGTDGQPLLRLAVAWLLAGLIAGVALMRVRPLPRAAVAGAVTLVVLLLGSQAGYALARNLRFSDVVFTRGPGPGPWLEAVVFTLGCALPRRLSRRRHRRPRGLHTVRKLGGLGQPRLSGSENGDAAEHNGDGQYVDGDRQHTRA
jgi:hypothetical protein